MVNGPQTAKNSCAVGLITPPLDTHTHTHTHRQHNAKPTRSTWFAVGIAIWGLFLLSGATYDDLELGTAPSPAPRSLSFALTLSVSITPLHHTSPSHLSITPLPYTSPSHISLTPLPPPPYLDPGPGMGETLTVISTVFWTLHITYTDMVSVSVSVMCVCACVSVCVQVCVPAPACACVCVRTRVYLHGHPSCEQMCVRERRS